MNDQQQQQHALTLKVMRLSRPSFATATLSKSGPFSSINKSDDISQLLQFPASFGSIFLGETFTAYLCLNNDARVACANVAFVVELQTASGQRFALCDTSAQPTANLLSCQTIEYIVAHEVKELGMHALVCAASYSVPASGGERRSFRKVYKFQVLNPIAVKTRVNPLSQLKSMTAVDGVLQSDMKMTVDDGVVQSTLSDITAATGAVALLLEAQVQNLTQSPMCLERMRLEPGPAFACRDLSCSVDSSSEDTVFDEFTCVQPQDARQYLFLLTPRHRQDVESARTATALGKLDIAWRLDFGEPGRLQTSQLSRKPPVIEAIDVALHQLPSSVVVERPFTIQLLVRNTSSQLMSPTITVGLQRSSLIPYGKSSHVITDIGPFESRIVDINLCAFQCGSHKLEGFRVVDADAGYQCNLEAIGEIYVRPI